VLVETTALVQRRLGLDAVAALRSQLMPLLTITWVDAELHRVALDATVRGSRDVSLVDHTSFELMRRRNLRRAFAFDDHFVDEGFDLEGAAP